MASTSKLTPKQKFFCQEYLVDCNAGAAYRRAGYKAATDETAWVNAAKLLKNHKVRSYIQELQQERSLRTEVTADRVIEEYRRIAFANISDALDFDSGSVNLKSSKTLPVETLAAISEVGLTESEKGRTVKLKMHDKLNALEKLARHVGLLSDFNIAIQTLQTYGIKLKQTPDGWEVENESNSATP